MCGLCLPRCPTYLKTGDENESPRGRIALMRAMAVGDLPVNARLKSHIDLCLACRTCENVCPSKVEYGVLLEAGRAILAAKRPHRPLTRFVSHIALDWLIARPQNLRVVARLLRFYQRSGAQRLLRAAGMFGLPGMARLDGALPPIGAGGRWREIYPAFGETRARIMLFTGCVAGVADRDTLNATVHVLTRLGYEVQIPSVQTCCGALHLHAGQRATAETLMHQNLVAFAKSAEPSDAAGGNLPIIHAASGCGATLAEYARHLPGKPEAQVFVDRLVDVNRFIAKVVWPENVRLAPLAKTIAVHDPCSLRNVLHGQQWPYTLLRQIPRARVVELSTNEICCGGAGAYPITEPHMAEKLRADKLEAIHDLAPDILVSTNLGCALHLQAGLRQQGSRLEVIHPIVLLERQLRWPGNPE